MENIFTLENFTDFSDKLNIDELYEKIFIKPAKKIGSFFNNRDHSTVMHSVEKITNEIEMVIDVRKDVEKLKVKCGEN